MSALILISSGIVHVYQLLLFLSQERVVHDLPIPSNVINKDVK